MKSNTATFLTLAGLVSSSYGAISIAVNAGELLDSGSNLVANTSVWAIVYDADGDGTLPGGLTVNSRLTTGNTASAYSAFNGKNITTNTTIGLDRILWAGIVDGQNTSGADAIGGVDLDNFTFTSLNVEANRMWAVYWFPGLTNAQRNLGASFEVGGIQINSPDTNSAGDIGMRFPTTDDTGTSYTAYFYNQTNGGVTPDSHFTAIAVPEPATFTLSALAALGLLRRRRA